MPSRPKQAAAHIVVNSSTGARLDNIKASIAIFRSGTIRRRKVALQPETISFKLTMPVGHHTLFVSAPGHYETAKRLHFVPESEPVVQVLLEPRQKAVFPPFDELPPQIKGVFGRSATQQRLHPEHRLFDGLSDFKKASALNILAKMDAVEVPYPGSKTILTYVDHVYDFFQDRIYLALKKGATSLARINKLVQEQNARFTVAPSALHEGFEEASFKTHEESGLGNLQLSFNADDPQQLRIDADIDIYTDVLRHLFGEVFRNHLTGLKTDPYRVYNVLIQNDIRPAYRLVASEE